MEHSEVSRPLGVTRCVALWGIRCKIELSLLQKEEQVCFFRNSREILACQSAVSFFVVERT